MLPAESNINQQMVTNLSKNKKDENIFIVMKYDNDNINK